MFHCYVRRIASEKGNAGSMKAAKRRTSHAGCVVAPADEKYLQKKVAF